MKKSFFVLEIKLLNKMFNVVHCLEYFLLRMFNCDRNTIDNVIIFLQTLLVDLKRWKEFLILHVNDNSVLLHSKVVNT